MNLAEQKKLAQHFCYVGVRGVALTTLWQRQRELSQCRPAFWKLAIQLSNKIFLQQFHDPRALDNSFQLNQSRVCGLPDILSHLRRPTFCSIKDFWGRNVDKFLRSSENLITFRKFAESIPLGKYNSRGIGPPKRFIPIPDIEIGGCARNDSLIAPLVN